MLRWFVHTDTHILSFVPSGLGALTQDISLCSRTHTFPSHFPLFFALSLRLYSLLPFLFLAISFTPSLSTSNITISSLRHTRCLCQQHSCTDTHSISSLCASWIKSIHFPSMRISTYASSFNETALWSGNPPWSQRNHLSPTITLLGDCHQADSIKSHWPINTSTNNHVVPLQ